MGEWVKVAEAGQLVAGQKMRVKAKGREIALFNVDGALYAISQTCTHSGGPLAQGRLLGVIVTCPWHGAQFDVTNGQCRAGPATTNVATYPVHFEDEAVFIEVI